MSVKSLRGVAAVAAVGCIAISSARAQSYQFDYSGSVVTWQAPTTGIYRITSIGARGGGISATTPGGASLTRQGGSGARVGGTISLTAGTTLSIAVGGAGGMGGDFGPGFGGGGGGGSFVVGAGNTPLFVAGGGGGASFARGSSGLPAFDQAGGHAQLTPAGGADSIFTVPIGQGGRHGRLQVNGVRVYGEATGGAGFYGDSQGAPGATFRPDVPVARSWPLLTPVSNGGFGGGGGGWGDSSLNLLYAATEVGIGAGGGGYTGGAGGAFILDESQFIGLSGGFGGGSFASSLASDTLFDLASERTGHGLVTIEFIAIPAPGAAALLALGGLLAARRRR